MKWQDSQPRGELTELQKCLLKAMNWSLQHSPRDGHCQFHSVGFAVKESHEQVRAHAVQWIRENEEECKNFTSWASRSNDFEEYMQGMADGAWGDNLTLYALSQHYKRAVCVLTDHVKNPWCQINPDFGDPIHLAFYAEIHYDAIDCGLAEA